MLLVVGQNGRLPVVEEALELRQDAGPVVGALRLDGHVVKVLVELAAVVLLQAGPHRFGEAVQRVRLVEHAREQHDRHLVAPRKRHDKWPFLFFSS